MAEAYMSLFRHCHGVAGHPLLLHSLDKEAPWNVSVKMWLPFPKAQVLLLHQTPHVLSIHQGGAKTIKHQGRWITPDALTRGHLSASTGTCAPPALWLAAVPQHALCF